VPQSSLRGQVRSPRRPRDPDLAEHAYFSDLVSTYGKTFRTWQYDRDDFPFGIPQLMMGLAENGRADRELMRDRDCRLGVSTARKGQNRNDIPDPQVARGANSWESGRTVQTRLEEMEFRRRPGLEEPISCRMTTRSRRPQ
jgi:hypothetical protein